MNGGYDDESDSMTNPGRRRRRLGHQQQGNRALCNDDPRRVEGCFGLFCLMTTVVFSTVFIKSRTIVQTSGPVRWQAKSANEEVPNWKEGYLDIHQIKAGSAESGLIVMPDGTSVLVDAGDVDASLFEAKYNGTFRAARPPPGTTAGALISNYLEHFGIDSLDYAVITHFHADHCGYPWSARRRVASYRVTGVSEVAERVRIKRLIDRGFPLYDYPVDLRTNGDRATTNYINFVDHIKSNVSIERFYPGRSDQIAPVKSHVSNFRIRNVKRDLDVSFSPDENPKQIYDKREVMSPTLTNWPRYDENRMSLAMAVEYGKFRYYTGGDNQHGIRSHLKERLDWTDVDTATPVAQAVGRVDVAKLNHHSHGTPSDFLRILQPSVVVQSSWNSDQPSDEALYLLTADAPYKDMDRPYRPPDVFATWTAAETVLSRGPAMLKYLSLEGHVLVRIMPPNATDSTARQYYHVYVLDDDFRVKAKHGPYEAVAATGISGPAALRREHSQRRRGSGYAAAIRDDQQFKKRKRARRTRTRRRRSS